ncbi:MAG: outer membrane protein assembly factor BamA [Planctomycetes bacterium]|nr:outer membrane protein assembly factor BamA [Planctomycetota bacterium]
MIQPRAPIPVLFLLVAMVSASAGESTSDSRPVVSGIVIKGLRKISEEAVRKRIGMRIGEPYNPSQADRDFLTLWNFADNKFPFTNITINPLFSDAGVVVEYQFRERPTVVGIQYEYLEDGQPTTYHVLKPRHYAGTGTLVRAPFNEQEIAKAVEGIRLSYIKKGFTDVSVDTRVSPAASEPESYPERVVVTFLITEGPRRVVKKVRFIGNTAFSDRELLKHLRSSEMRDVYTDGVDIDGWLHYENELARAVEIFYRSRGFLDATVSVGEPGLAPTVVENPYWVLLLEITEGYRYRIGKVSIEGNKVIPSDKLMDILRLHDFPYYSQDTEDILRAVLTQRYGDDGRVFSNVRAKPVFHDDCSVDITFSIWEDAIRKVRLIEPRGNRITRDDVIRREFALKPGDTYDRRLLQRTMENLAHTRFYKMVYPRPFPVGDDEVDLMFDITEGDFGKFSLAGTYVTGQGFLGTLALRWDNFDLFAPRKGFRGGGQQFELSLDRGSIDRVQLNFVEPYFLGYPVSLGFNAYDKTLTAGREYTEERTGAKLSFGKRSSLSRYNRRFLVSSVYVERQDVGISEIDASVDPGHPIWSEEGRFTLASLGGSFELDFVDRPQLPTSGWRTKLWGEVDGLVAGGEKEFLKYGASFGAFVPLFKTSSGADNVLSFKVQADWAEPFGDTLEVPVYERYTAGGIFTVRGYDYRSLGPRYPDDPSGDIVGGNFRFIGNVEFLFPLVPEHWIGVLFFDAGNVWADYEDFDPDDIRTSIGFGFRIEPLGLLPITLFWSRTLNDQPGDETEVFSFSLGTWF